MARFGYTYKDLNDDIFPCEVCGMKRNARCLECQRQARERADGRRLARLIGQAQARERREARQAKGY